MKSYSPDYPRPQLARQRWQNLNGTWQFAFDDQHQGMEEQWFTQWKGSQQITVPFTYETKASGIGEESLHDTLWYRRTLTLSPEDCSRDKRVLLHFEGSDYHTALWVNGTYVGDHTGGYARFSFDITHAVTQGENSITVCVTDPADEEQPRGKQRWVKESFACWYVQTTGIWKTVWLEVTPAVYLSRAKLTPQLAKAQLLLECDVAHHMGEGFALEATASLQGTFAGSCTVPVKKGRATASLDLYSTDVHEWGVHTWTPAQPNLYDLELKLLKDGQPVDCALSYFGMREISIDGENVLLNGSPLYQRLILDQGYWEESHLTPPDEQALVTDIEKVMALGYNGVRKHQKIEDERFLYWCDVKGLLVWSEMAAAYRFTDQAVDVFMKQWTEIIRQNESHPCIVTWTPINESWGVGQIRNDRQQQAFVQAIYHLTKALDSQQRPVVVNDGWEHTISDIITLHDYEEEGEVLFARYNGHWEEILKGKLYHNMDKSAFAQGFTYQGQPIILSEFGGIAYQNGEEGWGYGNKVQTEEAFLARFDSITTAIQMLPHCAGFCYTQVTDVQQEINGLMDMKRNYKADPQKIREINLKKTAPTHR